LRVDDAIEEAPLGVVSPGAIAAAAVAANGARERRDQVRDALSRDLEAARYAADRAFRQYDAADPANRLVTSELEARWNRALAHAAEVEGRIAMHDAATPAPIADPAFRNQALAPRSLVNNRRSVVGQSQNTDRDRSRKRRLGGAYRGSLIYCSGLNTSEGT
jgi:hypothetical protein